MAKPIFLVKCPEITYEDFHRIRKEVSDQMTDYHVLLYHDSFVDQFGFQVLNCPELTETKLDELQKIVLDSINKIKDNG